MVLLISSLVFFLYVLPTLVMLRYYRIAYNHKYGIYRNSTPDGDDLFWTFFPLFNLAASLVTLIHYPPTVKNKKSKRPLSHRLFKKIKK